MSDATPPSSGVSQKSWIPFQCPSCFSLFRAPRARAGEVGECPTCQVKIRLNIETSSASDKGSVSSVPAVTAEPITSPASSTKKEPILAKKAEIMDPADSPESDSESGRRRRRHHHGPKKEGLDWEESGSAQEAKGFPWMMVVSVLTGVVLLVAVASFWLKSRSSVQEKESTILVGTEESMQVLEETFALTKDQKKEEAEKSAAELVESFSDFDLEKAKQSIEGFLNAKSVEERSQFCRQGKDLRPVMMAFYATRLYEPEGFKSIEEGKVSYRDSLLSTNVTLGDYSQKSIALERVDGEYFVDWESWEGFCEMDISAMMRLKPTVPKELRLRYKPLDYYNYHFFDDTEWKSYRLTFISSEKSLWGYVKKGSELQKALDRSSTNAIIVKAVYPEKSRSKDQVEILEIVTSGWVKDYKKDSSK